MAILVAVGDCSSAFLIGPVLRELRARSITFRIAAGAFEDELAALREQLGPEVPVRSLADDESARHFADELLASSPTTSVAYVGVVPFTRCLAQQAALRDVRVVRLDAGVEAFGRPVAAHPWADAWCVASDLERQALLAHGESSDAVHVVGDMVAEAVASVARSEAPPRGVAIVAEHDSASSAVWRKSLVDAGGLPLLTQPAHEGQVEPWIAYVAKAQVLVTDSVGWQRVAVALGVPCVVQPRSGLWAPGIAAGLVSQLPPDSDTYGRVLQRAARQPRGKPTAASGVAARIVDVLVSPAKPTQFVLPSDGDASGRTFGNDEAALVAMVLQRGTLNSTRGTMVTTFERRFAQWLGSKHAIACASGSAAVHVAIATLQLQPGDEVITTPITDMGAITPILYEGGVPVFADVDPETLNVTAAALRAQITPRTRAVIVTHLFGMPCEMEPILRVAREHDLVVIEDAAQAFGATCGERKVGTFGEVAAFSLQQGKHITSGEGGIVATDDDDLARRVFLFVNKAWGYGDPAPDHYFPALNYRLTELQGAVLMAQLPKLDEIVERRRAVASRLRERLADVAGITLPGDPPHGKHSWWKFAFFVDARTIDGGGPALGKKMQASGVACSPRYIQKPAFECALFEDWRRSPVTAMPLQNNPRRSAPMPLFRRADYPGAVRALERVVVLPINERYTDEHVDQIAAVIRHAATELAHA